MAASQYTSSYPDNVPFDTKYRDFISEFYRISDTPDAHEKYSQQFTPDAHLVMASKEVDGTEEILAFRKGMWEKVKSRSHKPVKIFPFGPNSNEVMIYGSVEYEFKAGGSSGLEWAARGTLEEVDGKVVWSQYQVFMDTAAQQAKK